MVSLKQKKYDRQCDERQTNLSLRSYFTGGTGTWWAVYRTDRLAVLRLCICIRWRRRSAARLI